MFLLEIKRNKLSHLSPQLLLADGNKKQFIVPRVGNLPDKTINTIKRKLWAIGYTDKRMRVVRVVLSFLTRYTFCHFKVAQVAQYARVSRTTAETVLRDLQSMGLYIQDRRWRTHVIGGVVQSREVNSHWWLRDLFRDRNLLISLSYYFSFLKRFRALPLLMILSCSQQASYEASRTSVQNFEDLSIIKDVIYKTGTGAGRRNERVTVGHPRHQYSHDGKSKSIAGESSTVRLEKREKGRTMNAQGVDTIRSLVLTDKGKAELSCFDERALKYTDAALYKTLQRESFSPVSAWKWFCKVATRYSKEHNLKLDYGLVNELTITGGFKIHDANVQSVASVPKKAPSKGSATGRTNDGVQAVPDKTPELVARIKSKEVSEDERASIAKKIAFFTGALKAAQESVDAHCKRTIPFYKIMLNGWQEKLAQIDAQASQINQDDQKDKSNPMQPVVAKKELSVDPGREFVFGLDDAPIGDYYGDEESPWM